MNSPKPIPKKVGTYHKSSRRRIIIIASVFVLVIAIALIVYFVVIKKKAKKSNKVKQEKKSTKQIVQRSSDGSTSTSLDIPSDATEVKVTLSFGSRSIIFDNDFLSVPATGSSTIIPAEKSKSGSTYYFTMYRKKNTSSSLGPSNNQTNPTYLLSNNPSNGTKVVFYIENGNLTFPGSSDYNFFYHNPDKDTSYVLVSIQSDIKSYNNTESTFYYVPFGTITVTEQ